MKYWLVLLSVLVLLMGILLVWQHRYYQSTAPRVDVITASQQADPGPPYESTQDGAKKPQLSEEILAGQSQISESQTYRDTDLSTEQSDRDSIELSPEQAARQEAKRLLDQALAENRLKPADDLDDRYQKPRSLRMIFDEEVRDHSWAGPTELALRDRFIDLLAETDAEIQDYECRSSLCILSIINPRMDEEGNPTQQILRAMSLIDSSADFDTGDFSFNSFAQFDEGVYVEVLYGRYQQIINDYHDLLKAYSSVSP